MYIGVNSVEVKTEADDFTECLHDDRLITGLFSLCGFSLYIFCDMLTIIFLH